MTRDLEPAGIIHDNLTYDFVFNKVEKLHETYYGIVMRVRYLIRVVINRPYSRISEECEFFVQHTSPQPDINLPLNI